MQRLDGFEVDEQHAGEKNAICEEDESSVGDDCVAVEEEGEGEEDREHIEESARKHVQNRIHLP